MSDENDRPLTLQELPELRRKTETVSRFLQGQIAAHLETLRPLFAPERILGKYAGGKMDPPGTERALAELQEKYQAFTRKPYDLPTTLDPNWLTLVGSALVTHSRSPLRSSGSGTMKVRSLERVPSRVSIRIFRRDNISNVPIWHCMNDSIPVDLPD